MKKHTISVYVLRTLVMSLVFFVCSYSIGASASDDTHSFNQNNKPSSGLKRPLNSAEKNDRVTQKNVQKNQRQKSNAICSGRKIVTSCNNLNGSGKDKCNNYYSIKYGKQKKCRIEDDGSTCGFGSTCGG